MARIFSKDWYYEKNEKGFLQYLHKKNGTKLTKENLTFSFFDLEGHGYYKFPKDLALPMNRLGQLYSYMMWLSAGITGSELDKMLENADKALTDGITKGKNAAKIGYLISELRDRKNMIIHPELFYNIIAVQIIRDDEVPTEFNNEIQLQKVEEFKKMDSQNDTFFLNIREYLTALNWSNITRDELINILKDSRIRLEAARKTMQNLFEQQSEEAQMSSEKI